MLRLFVLLMVLVNGLYFAWSHEWLRGYGFGPTPTTEPQRLERQIRPEAIRILSPQEARSEAAAEQPPVKPPECLQAGPMEGKQVEALRLALKDSLPDGAWQWEEGTEPARWIVYMGKYPSAEAQAKKRAELLTLKVKIEPLNNPKLEPGLSLGGFETQAAAEAALNVFSQRGVRTARVVLERVQVTGTLLRLPAVDDAQRVRLNALKPALADKSLQPCPVRTAP
jgi:hypothetical protein